MEFQESEKQRKRLEDQNLKLKLQIEEIKPKADRAEVAAELLQSTIAKAKSDSSLSAFTIELQKIMDNLPSGAKSPKKVLICFYHFLSRCLVIMHREIKQISTQTSIQSGQKSPSITPKDAKNIKLLTEELQKLKNMNEQLISRVESKNDQVILILHLNVY